MSATDWIVAVIIGLGMPAGGFLVGYGIRGIVDNMRRRD